METKRCNICGIEKSLSEEYFSKWKASKDGYKNQCKECASKRSAEYRCKNREKEKQRHKQYRQDNKIHELVYKEANKSQILAYMKKYREDNREALTQHQKQYRQSNPDIGIRILQRHRALKADLPATFTSQQWEECKSYFNNRCAYCGKQEILTQEHFVPVTKGGSYTKENIVPACKSCNSSKCDKLFSEWYIKQKLYSKKREQSIHNYLNQPNVGRQLSIEECALI